MPHLWIFLIALSLTGCVATQEQQVEKFLSLGSDHYYHTATVKNDGLDTVAIVTTRNGFQEKRGLLGIVGDDVFLRAFIDKKTGRASYQVY